MIRTDSFRTAAVLALLIVGTGFAAGAALGTDGADEPQRKMKLVWNQDGDRDELQVEELDLAVGESRELTTESGKPVTISRTEAGYRIDVDGKVIELADAEQNVFFSDGSGKKLRKIIASGEGDGSGMHRRMHRIEIDGEGDCEGECRHHAFVVGDGDPHVLKLIGEDGGKGFAFRTGGGLPFMGHEHLLSRIEKSEKFLALDDTTREIVREVIRDAAPRMEWIEAGEGEPGENLDIIIERKKKGDAD